MNIDSTTFDVVALVGKAEIPLEAYHQLQIGDILLLDQKVEEPWEVHVGGETPFRGRPGLCETRKAVKIL